MGYLPVLLGLGTALCWGTADYVSRRPSRSMGYYRTVIYSHLTTLLFLFLIVPALRLQVSAPVFPVALLVVTGAMNFLAFINLYRALHTGRVSVVAPIAYTYPAVTTALSVLLLGATVGLSQGLGISAVIAGVVLLSTRLSELKMIGKGGQTAGIGSALISSILFGTVYVSVGYATPFTSFALPPLILRGAAVLVGLIAAPLLKETLRPTKESFSSVIFIMGALESVGFLSFNYGVSLGPDAVPVVAALSGMGGAVAAGYAMAFLHERLERNQLVGLLLSALGVTTLLYFGS